MNGIVYFVGSSKIKVVKIGMVEGVDIENRVKTLQTGFPYKLEVFATIPCEEIQARIVEGDLHKIFAINRLNGEWFSLTGFLSAFIATYLKEKKLTAYASSKKTKRTWYLSEYKFNDSEAQCILFEAKKHYSSQDNKSSIIAGMEIMLKQTLSRNVLLQNFLDEIFNVMYNVEKHLKDSDIKHFDQSMADCIAQTYQAENTSDLRDFLYKDDLIDRENPVSVGTDNRATDILAERYKNVVNF
jgi:hypothetical protein